ncbi:MAG: hypothetical protein IK130_12425 [Oscillospiraceae bacterium]|nr:hypothetical protein [Oscillospiraceae bacterium]
MAERYPMWWIHSGSRREEDVAPQDPPQALLQDLLGRIRGGDRETLLLLFLLVLLWQEDADKKLLLALAYILL